MHVENTSKSHLIGKQTQIRAQFHLKGTARGTGTAQWAEFCRVLLDNQAVFLSPACQKATEKPSLEQIIQVLPREYSEIHSNGNQYPIMM